MQAGVVARGVVVLLVAGLLTPVSAANAACGPDFEFIGARGSGQSASQDELGMGFEIADTFRNINTAISRSGMTIEPHGVDYPAVAVGGGFMEGLHGATKVLGLGVVYNDSVDDGAAAVVSEIRRQHRQCSSTRFILSGYSQGAEAVAEGVGLLTSEERSLIAGSIYFGDPMFNASDSRAARGNFEPNHNEMFTPRWPWASVVNGPVFSYCHNADPICGITVLAEWPAGGNLYIRDFPHIDGFAKAHNSGDLFAEHTNYVTSGDTRRAATAMVNALRIDSDAISDEPIDVVFLVSGAATMEPMLPYLKEGAAEMAGVVAAGSSSYRVAVMEQVGALAQVRTGFTTDVNAIVEGFEAIDADSGESATDMAYAVRSAFGVTWRPGARRAVVLVNSFIGHFQQPGRQIALEAVREAASAVDAAVYPISLSFDNQHVMSFMADMASATGGYSDQVNWSESAEGYFVPGIKDVVRRAGNKPVAILTGPSRAVVGRSVTFSAAGTRLVHPTDEVEKYHWDSTAGINAGWTPPDDGGPTAQRQAGDALDGLSDTEMEPASYQEQMRWSQTEVPIESIMFPEPGVYPVSVRVDTREGVADATRSVTVVPAASQAPSEPRGLRATEGDGSVTLSWTPGDVWADYYVIRDQRGAVVDAFRPVAPSPTSRVASSDLSYTLHGLSNTELVELTLTAGNTVGLSDESNAVVANPSAADPPGAASLALHSNSSLSLTNAFTVTGSGAGVFVNGDFKCTVDVSLSGEVIVMGDAYLTNKCHIAGDLIVQGNVTMNSKPTVDGSVVAGGTVKFQSTARVGGDIRSGGSFTSTDGKSTEWLTSQDVVGGEVIPNAVIEPIRDVSPLPVEYDVVDWPEAETVTWRQWMNAIASANGAPAWSQGLTSNPGCVMAPWGSSVNGDTVSIIGNTVVDARQIDSGCASVTLQGMTLEMSADLVLYADSAKVVNGLTVRSADGNPHVLRILVPGQFDGCATGHNIEISGGTTIDPKVIAQLITPGNSILRGSSEFTGHVVAGCIVSSGHVGIDFAMSPDR